jgi:hypothetical protein
VPQDVAGHPGPQPPPPAIGAELPSDPLERAAKTETCLFAGNLQSGHEILLLTSLKEHLRSNFVSHFEHLYSYIGIAITF